METGTDEEVLTEWAKFMGRVGISSQFIQNEDGLITHQVMVITCGDKMVVSDPQALEWPLQPMPRPEALGGRAH